MKRILSTLFLIIILMYNLLLPSYATAVTDSEMPDYTVTLFNILDEQTRSLLSQIGIGTENTAEDFLNLSPYKVISALWGFLKTDMHVWLKRFCTILALLMLKALTDTLGGGSKTAEAASGVTMLAVLFAVISPMAEIITDCTAAIRLTGDFMLALIPVLAGVITFMGKPQAALCFNTLMFGFAQLVSVFFCNSLPAAGAVGTALCTACALNPLTGMTSLFQTIVKCVNKLMGLAASLFTAVLTVREVIAGAADTVSVKGLRFLVGSSVPVVGSALGDALNCVVSGVKLLSGGIGALGIACVALINLPVLLRLYALRAAFGLISCFSELWQMKEIPDFLKNVNACLSVFTAVICFNGFVFIIALTIVLMMQGG